ncbi:MAG: hypothetical protein JNL69_07720 [Bacteroidia bacterium]|nr:hypothetical protein [Bacteroidia bacterium]
MPEITSHSNRWRVVESEQVWLSNIAVVEKFISKRSKVVSVQLNKIKKN